jgi:NTP pyrophosphatase (non-canonical NTP hydrolase)
MDQETGAAFDAAMDDVAAQVSKRATDAAAKYGAFTSAHEAYGVIIEEVAELFDEVRRKGHLRSRLALEQECIDIAAAALRYAAELRIRVAEPGLPRESVTVPALPATDAGNALVDGLLAQHARGRGELERLQGEVDKARITARSWELEARSLRRERDDARAEVGRLRKVERRARSLLSARRNGAIMVPRDSGARQALERALDALDEEGAR